MKIEAAVVAQSQNRPDTRGFFHQMSDLFVGTVQAVSWVTSENIKAHHHRNDPVAAPVDTYYGF